MHNKLLISTALILGLILMFQTTATAQYAAGVSYENRSEDPTNGFGLQLESSIFSVPMIDFRMRAHFSYFSEENELTRAGISYDEEIDTYDFGVAAIGAVSLGLIDPYVGVGIGSESWSISREEISGFEDFDDSRFYYYGVGGISFSLLPVVHPYIELRYSGFNEFEQEDIFESDRRILVGVSLRF